MTYRYNSKNPLGFYFQSGNNDLPLDKLQSFWPLRAAGSGYSSSPDLIGNLPLTASGKVAWAASNPVSGAALGCSDFSAATTYWRTEGTPANYTGEGQGVNWWLSFWFYPKTGAAGDVIAAASSTSYVGWFAQVSASDELNFAMGSGSAWVQVATSNTVTYNAWNFGIIGHDGSTGFVSLNSGTAATASGTISSASSWGVTFGNWWTSGNDLNGYVADSAYFVDVSANATSTEIAALYNGGNGNTLLNF